MSARREGQCRCGQVRFAAEGAPIVTVACHCRGCQQMSASAFTLTSVYPADKFQVTAGDTVVGGMKGNTKHMFCGECLTFVYSIPEGMEMFVNVRSTEFENAAEHRPFIDMFLREGLPWVSSGAERSYDGAPEQTEFGPLMAAYAEWDGRVKA